MVFNKIQAKKDRPRWPFNRSGGVSISLRTGIDIISNKRIEKLLEKGKDGFYRRLFTDREIEYLDTKNHNPATVSGIFASKEAVSKLLGTGIGTISWKDIEIGHEPSGRPYLIPSASLSAVGSARLGPTGSAGRCDQTPSTYRSHARLPGRCHAPQRCPRRSGSASRWE